MPVTPVRPLKFTLDFSRLGEAREGRRRQLPPRSGLALGPVELGFAIVPLAWAAAGAIVALIAWRVDRRTRTATA